MITATQCPSDVNKDYTHIHTYRDNDTKKDTRTRRRRRTQFTRTRRSTKTRLISTKTRKGGKRT